MFIQGTAVRTGLFSGLRQSLRVVGGARRRYGVATTATRWRSECALKEMQEVVTEDCHVAAAMRIHLAERIGQQRFALWFGPHAKFCLGTGGLTVYTPCTFTRDWLRRNFACEVRECCRALTGRDVHVEFEIDESMSAEQVGPANCAATVLPAKEASCASTTPKSALHSDTKRSTRHNVPQRTTPSQIRAEPTLAAFVVGAGNEYAFGAVAMTGRGLQQASPVLLHGPTGVGKTHLLRSVRADYRRRHPRARVLYLTAEQFTTSFVEALRGSGLPSFRQKCRGADLLLVDDVQFFAGKRASLEELQHTLDTMLGEGRQVMLASDRSLAELRPLGKEMISRLAGGLICEIQPPDYATRLEIVRRLAHELAIEIDDEVATMIATRVPAGARELRGALHRLHATSLACQQPISPKLASTALEALAQQCVRTVRLPDVEHAVCHVFGIDPAQLRSERKSRSIQEPRMLAMWLSRKYTRAPWSEIGQFFGRRSHSTVISAHRKMERLIRSQAEIGVNDQMCGVEEAIRRVEVALRTA